eukprot:3674294-Rhodomonas_salina.1
MPLLTPSATVHSGTLSQCNGTKAQYHRTKTFVPVLDPRSTPYKNLSSRYEIPGPHDKTGNTTVPVRRPGVIFTSVLGGSRPFLGLNSMD